MRPMLATPGLGVPRGPDWVHEVKWDGMRVLVDVHDGAVRITSRTERDVTVAFPELADAAAGIADFGDLLLDGEVVVMRDGLPSFGSLAERFNVTSDRVARTLAAQAPVTLMVFDVLRAAGSDLTGRALRQRRDLLDGLAGAGLTGRWVQVPPVFDDGDELIAATADAGVEGIVSKRLDSRYHPGARSDDWRKSVHRSTGSFVLGGWRPQTGTTDRLGALLLGSPAPGGLLFRGRIGSGLAGRAGQSLLLQLRELTTEVDPFVVPPPTADVRGTRWLRPDLIADVEFHGTAPGGRLRQPTWRGLRPDLEPADLTGQVELATDGEPREGGDGDG